MVKHSFTFILIRRIFFISVFGVLIGGFFFYLENMDKAPPKEISNLNQLYRQVKIAAFGDSLTAGYQLSPEESFPYALQTTLGKQGYNVVVENFGVSGETSQKALSRVSNVLAFQPDIVLLQFGANDILRGGSVNTVYRNLQEMINIFKENNIKVLLVGLNPPAKMIAFRLLARDSVYEELAQEMEVMLYPNFMDGIYNVSDNQSLLLQDEVHPSAAGTKIMAEKISPFVGELLESYTTSRQ